MTGVNPGKHNIYDFLARDASTYLPFLSSRKSKGLRKRSRLGNIPFLGEDGNQGHAQGDALLALLARPAFSVR